jgi:hypothetical protein
MIIETEGGALEGYFECVDGKAAVFPDPIDPTRNLLVGRTIDGDSRIFVWLEAGAVLEQLPDIDVGAEKEKAYLNMDVCKPVLERLEATPEKAQEILGKILEFPIEHPTAEFLALRDMDINDVVAHYPYTNFSASSFRKDECHKPSKGMSAIALALFTGAGVLIGKKLFGKKKTA